MRRRALRLVLGLVVAALALAWQNRPTDGPASTPAGGGQGAETVAQAFADRRSDVWVTVEGTVQRALPDDNEGSRHQRFILGLSGDHTVLVAHNIDLADRVPLRQGDRVTVRGEYEWNERGGVVHWTHHDPAGRRDGGWIEHEGVRYR